MSRLLTSSRHMINIPSNVKMMRNFVVFSLFIAAIQANGEFSVLNSPKAISFKGNDPLQSQYVGDVLYAALGNAIAGDSSWSGMTVNDPFNMAKSVIAVYVDDVSHINTPVDAKTYPLVGSDTAEALSAVSAQLEATNEPVCDINFSHFEDGVESFKVCFGEIVAPTAKQTKHLNPTLHSADKQFLQEIGYINAASENLADMVKKPNVLIIRSSLENIAKAHGAKSDAVEEASKLLSSAIGRLLSAAQKSSDSVFFVQLTSKNVAVRSKREVLPPNNKENPYNLAEYYSEDYPVIFNIILWFMVVFGLSLLAICYAIGSMDPGRDSIIYRMTSTRMKKDN